MRIDVQLFAAPGIDPAVSTMDVPLGICGANSFLLPTHHVNAFLMMPSGYRMSDYLRAGSGLPLLFIVLSSSMLYAFCL